MPKISVPQKNKVLEAPLGKNLMLFLQEQGIPVASSCLGDAICGKCRMRVGGAVPLASQLEQETLKRNQASPGDRLSCQVQIDHNLTVETTYW